MADQQELEFRLNRVGDGPMFEVLLNNVRLDITKVGQLYSVRVSGLITERQTEKLKEMFLHLFASSPGPSQEEIWENDDVGRFANGRMDDVIAEGQSVAEDDIPFDGPYVRGPIIE